MTEAAQTKPEENESGIDLDQLRFNLSLSPEHRIAHHQAALDLIWELENSLSLPELETSK